MATAKKAAAAQKGLQDLFLDGLKDIYDAEKNTQAFITRKSKEFLTV